MSLVQMSIGGGALILFTAALRSVALNKLPKTTFLILWGITVLRLLVPVSIPSPFSVYSRTEQIFQYAAPEASTTVPVLIPASASAAVPDTPDAPAAPAPLPVWTILWLAGASLLAAYFAVSYIRSRRKFRVSLPEESPFVLDWLARRRSLRPIQARQSDRIASPLTYGVLRPVILLPKHMDRSDETALTCVLAHEYVHIRRFDALSKLALAAALCVHWFNPLVWVMYILANRDLELSCDGQVLRALGQQGRAPYALTLLSMEEAKRSGLSLFSHFSRNAMTERIGSIMKYKKASALAVFLAAVLVAGATAALATSPAPDGAAAASDPPAEDTFSETEGGDSAPEDGDAPIPIDEIRYGVELFWCQEDGSVELAPGAEIPVSCLSLSGGQQVSAALYSENGAELELILTEQDSGQVYSAPLVFDEDGDFAYAILTAETAGNYEATLKNAGSSNATVSLIDMIFSFNGLDPEEAVQQTRGTGKQAVQVDPVGTDEPADPADSTGTSLISRTHPITGEIRTYDLLENPGIS